MESYDAQTEEIYAWRYPVGKFHSKGPLSPEERRIEIEEIRVMSARLRRIVQPLTPEQLGTPYRPDGWSIRQVVHHLADNNMNAYLRFRRGLTEDAPEIPSYREELWAEQDDYQEEAVETSLSLLDHLNRRFVTLLNTLDEADYNRTFVSIMLGTMTLDTAVQRYNWHNRHHIGQISSLIERSGW